MGSYRLGSSSFRITNYNACFQKLITQMDEGDIHDECSSIIFGHRRLSELFPNLPVTFENLQKALRNLRKIFGSSGR